MLTGCHVASLLSFDVGKGTDDGAGRVLLSSSPLPSSLVLFFPGTDGSGPREMSMHEAMPLLTFAA